MPLSRDPTSAPPVPRNKQDMWRCVECNAWNEPEDDECYFCGEAERRPK